MFSYSKGVPIEQNDTPSLKLITSLLMKLIAIARVLFDASWFRDIAGIQAAARRLLSSARREQQYRTAAMFVGVFTRNRENPRIIHPLPPPVLDKPRGSLLPVRSPPPNEQASQFSSTS